MLDSIDESFFNSIEDDYTDEQDDEHKACAVCQTRPGGVAGAEEAFAEGFDDGGNGVDVGHPAPLFGDAGDGVDDRRTIHPEADAKTDQVLQVTVFRGHGGDDDAEAKAESGHE